MIPINRYNRSIDGKALLRLAYARIDLLIVALAILARFYEYAKDRSMWLDEGSLYNNLVNTPILPIWRPLKNAQLAPPGFLALERLIAQTLGNSSLALRLVPLISGILAVLIFQKIAKRLLEPRAATAALALFALGYDPIYYSVELKQYSSDLAISLACLWSALLVMDRTTPRRMLGLGTLAVFAPWFSHPAAFTITGLGLGLLSYKAIDGNRKEFLKVAAIGGLGAISFVGSYLTSLRLLANPGAMQAFWSTTFLRFPPRTLQEGRELGGQCVNLMTNPLDLISPFWPWLSVSLVILGVLGGLVILFRDRPRGLVLLFLPLAITAAASAAHRYPFHGRLILFLVPAFDIAIVMGLDLIGRRFRRRDLILTNGLLGLLLLHPLLNSAYQVASHDPRGFTTLGELHVSPFQGKSLSPQVDAAGTPTFRTSVD